MLYIMLWIEEEEKWHYAIDSFDGSKFEDGYVDYYVKVENGTIVSDSYKASNAGKAFDDCYDKSLWAS